MQAIEQKIEGASAVSGVASKLSIFSGTGTLLFGSMTSEFLFAAIGAICTIGTLIVNAYYKRKAHELAQRRTELAHELAMRAEERRTMLAQAQINVMRERGEVVQTDFDSAPVFLAGVQDGGGGSDGG